jgi:hypothetical protein
MDPNQPSYKGENANQGRLVPREVHEGEGWALLKCGNTEVVLSYTILHQMSGHLAVGSRGDSNVKEYGACQRAINAITCEASLGNSPKEEDHAGCLMVDKLLKR